MQRLVAGELIRVAVIDGDHELDFQLGYQRLVPEVVQNFRKRPVLVLVDDSREVRSHGILARLSGSH